MFKVSSTVIFAKAYISREIMKVNKISKKFNQEINKVTAVAH